ncbi:hypothetical protein [Spiroplasma citri]|nr:hypothetical protein [Spiroplasma citri]
MKKMIGYVPEFVTFPENISSYNFLKYLGKQMVCGGDIFETELNT